MDNKYFDQQICNLLFRPHPRSPISLTLSGTRPAVEVASTSGIDANADRFQLKPMQHILFL